jgi:hypothetical protein
MSVKQFQSFEEFWPFYLAEHSKPETRTLHAIGTMAGMACLLGLIASRKWKLLPLALVPGYGAAWLSHFLVEKNRPATFDYPLWSFMGDYKMLGMMMAGTLDAEIDRIKNEGSGVHLFADESNHE